MTAWSALLLKSSASVGSNAWEHLNSVISGGTIIIGGDLSSSINTSALSSSLDNSLSVNTVSGTLTAGIVNSLTATQITTDMLTANLDNFLGVYHEC